MWKPKRKAKQADDPIFFSFRIFLLYDTLRVFAQCQTATSHH